MKIFINGNARVDDVPQRVKLLPGTSASYIRVPVRVAAAPFPIQLPPNAPERQQRMA